MDSARREILDRDLNEHRESGVKFKQVYQEQSRYTVYELVPEPSKPRQLQSSARGG
jgi:hypothetical protein